MKYIGIGMIWMGIGIAIAATAFSGAPEAVVFVALVLGVCAVFGTLFAR